MAGAGVTQTVESLIGPPSELISIAEFIQSNAQLLPYHPTSHLTQGFPEEKKVAEQCSISDISETLINVWSNPTLSAYLMKDHEHMVNALYDTSALRGKKARKSYLPDPHLPSEVSNLQRELDAVQLMSWRLQPDAAMLMRAVRNSDKNILNRVKSSPVSSYSSSATDASVSPVILTVSCYSRVPWGPSYISRMSQQAFLSSQSLQDVYEAIPCIYRTSSGASSLSPKIEEGCVICIENYAYGDKTATSDYAEKLFQHLSQERSKRGLKFCAQALTSMRETLLSSLSLRINEPYWLLHCGNCEHFLVVDQIRLRHPTDPTSGYPLSLHVAPPLPALCRACHKFPAVRSITGDLRLGDSPCALCAPCWETMGSPSPEVIVLPLPIFQTMS